jgi:outer membrane protein
MIDGNKHFFYLALLLLSLGVAPPSLADDLVAVYQQAAGEDPQLEAAREALAAVQESHEQARAALFLPRADFSANVNQDRQSVQFGGAATGSSGSSTFVSGGYTLTLTQPILHYERVMGKQQADKRVAQAEAEFAAAEIAVLLRVAERYFEVLATADNLRFAQAQRDTLARGLAETQQRQRVGFLALADVQEAQAGYDRALSDVVDAEHQLRDAQESLQEITGKQYGQLAVLRDDIPLVAPEPASEARWVDQALGQNLSLRVSEQLVEIAKAAVELQKSGHLPTLDAVGSQSFSTSGGRFGSSDVEDTIVGLSLTVPLYQGGQVNSKIREAEHRHSQAKANLKQAQRAVHREASNAFLGVVGGISRVKALRQTVSSSQTALAATQAGFRAGRRTALDVIIAEREQLRAQNDYARARYDYLLATLRLKQAVGTLSPEDLVKINGLLVSHS